jgi:hypothetical protein
MHLEDTKDKIYIHDLDQELDSVDTPDAPETITFLAEIEKRFTGIPQTILTGEKGSSSSKEMVLYQVPSSITVPEAQDNVRRAIIETRARARAKRAEEDAKAIFTTETHNAFQPEPVLNGRVDPDPDPDEMDIG